MISENNQASGREGLRRRVRRVNDPLVLFWARQSLRKISNYRQFNSDGDDGLQHLNISI